MSRTYDAPLDVDRGSSVDRRKQAELSSKEELAERATTRSSYRELDAMVESRTDLSRARRDAERAVPRETVAPLGHPLKDRRLPEGDAIRLPISERQRRDRFRVRREVAGRMSNAAHTELHRLLDQDRGSWAALNDKLSDAVGDAQQLSPNQLRRVQRIDRTIQAYEKDNDRSHVVYTAVKLPAGTRVRDLEAFARRSFTPGDVVEFDRYTMSTHSMEESAGNDQEVIFEMATRRGMYLGDGRKRGTTEHLLPRGMAFTVQGTHTATYRRSDGTRARAVVVQLTDHQS